MPAEHKFLKFILPKRAFNAVKAGTKKWLIECKCGHKRDYWDLGGVRYGEHETSTRQLFSAFQGKLKRLSLCC